MPCHGLCLACVHISEHDLLLYLFIFLFREHSHFPFLYSCPRSSHFCCFFHFPCHGNHQWECYTLVGSMHSSLTGHAHVSELLGSKVILVSVCAHLLTYSAHLLSVEMHPLFSTLTCSQNGDDPHCHHVGHFFSRLACNGKEGFWSFNIQQQKTYIFPTPLSLLAKKSHEIPSLHKSNVPSPYPQALANWNRKIWAI